MPRPPIWQRVRTDAGWHLRLMGANGEPIWATEVYKDKRQVMEAVAATMNAANALATTHFTNDPRGQYTDGEPIYGVQDIDERHSKTDREPVEYFIAECREDGTKMPFREYQDRAEWVGRHRLSTGHTIDMYVEEL